MYGNTNLGRPIIGTKKSLKEMTVEELQKYFEKWFVAENMIVGVVGDYGAEEEILDLIKQEFAPLINDARKTPEKDIFEWDAQEGPRIKLITRDLDQAAVYLGFRGLPLKHKLHYPLEIANLILGGGWMSRLLREVREERGWAYSIGSGTDEFLDVGDLVIGAGLPKDKLNDAIELITEISYGIGGKNKWKITKEEIEIAKNTYRGRLALAFDKPENVLGSALDNLMFEGKIKTPQEIMEKIDSVTLKEVEEVCELIFKPQNLSIAVVGDYKELNFKI
jgi:predicted Zn-dependent peptidase